MVSVCDDYCIGCVFNQNASGDKQTCCTFYLVTDIRRPCPAGAGCTVRKLGKKIGKWSYEHQHGWETAKLKGEARRNTAYKEELKKLRKEQRMMTKVCPVCGEEFQTDNPRKVYCSERCKNKAKSRTHYRRNKNAKAKEKSAAGKH